MVVSPSTDHQAAAVVRWRRVTDPALIALTHREAHPRRCLASRSPCRCSFGQVDVFALFVRVSFAPRMSASVKSHASKVERRRSAFRRFARTKSTSLKIDARRSHPERSASVKLTSMKSFQHSVDSDRSVFLNEIVLNIRPAEEGAWERQVFQITVG